MRTVLTAIQQTKNLNLQIAVTGMHLDPRHGQSIKTIEKEGWKIDATVPWNPSFVGSALRADSSRSKRTVRTAEPTKKDVTALATATGNAIASLSIELERLQSDVILIVGDRVEAFAAASAAHLSGRVVAHIHGGDRAMGQVDDSLRHAITKLAHVHFPATKSSAQRLIKLGEDPWRIHQVGSPGIDGIQKVAAPWRDVTKNTPLKRHGYSLVILHPVDAVERLEHRRAMSVLNACASIPTEKIVVIYPNNDPGSPGIIRAIESKSDDSRFLLCKDVPRPTFLALLRDAAVLIGNSSSGIIEAASFHTPVIDIGPRQQGRERCEDVTNVSYRQNEIASAIAKTWNNGKPLRSLCDNLYAGKHTGKSIARILSKLHIDQKLTRKLIAY